LHRETGPAASDQSAGAELRVKLLADYEGMVAKNIRQ